MSNPLLLSGFSTPFNTIPFEEIKLDGEFLTLEQQMSIKSMKKKLKITEIDVTVLYDTGLKTSTKDPVSHSMSVIGSLLESIAIHHPLKYLGTPGIILLLVGIVFSVIVMGIFNDTRHFSIPSTLLALGSSVIGLMLLLMSVVLYSISHQPRRNL